MFKETVTGSITKPGQNNLALNQIMDENKDLKNLIQEMQEELDYGKQRENKLMFFLYILKEKGFPISDIFETEIKDIPTTRFSSQFDDEYKTLYEELKKERKDKQDSDMSCAHVRDFKTKTDRVYMGTRKR